MEPITKNDYAKMFMGYQPGQFVPPEVEVQIEKELEYYRKEALKAKLAASQVKQAAPPEYISLTNKADNSVIRGVMEDGKFREIPVDKLTTPKGTFSMQSPTNAVPVILPDGSIAQNYTSQTLLGEDEAALGTYSPGQTAAPAQTPAPTPMPSAAPSPTPNQQAPQQAQFVRVVSPDGKTGIIPAGKVDQALKQGFQLAP